ncbi:50S ribosomal protein L23 [Candidatus Gottesmanbacteria bacterium]|nr:50S ribosomal protein L23 [Candidatus Gottesmanbacteria bacterium]
MHILNKPIITERSLTHAKLGLYTFAVSKNITKKQIRKEVEKHYKVNVESVKTIKLKNKTGNLWKKALVKVEKGQKIALFDVTT